MESRLGLTQGDAPRTQEPDTRFDTALEASAVARSSPKVLLVDDDPNITRALWRRLKGVGIEAIRSHNAKEGLILAVTKCPDVIIIDQKMPGIPGERLLMNLKYSKHTKNIPVIMLTGVTFDGKQDYALKRRVLGPGGCASYLNKPLNFDALLVELRRHMRVPGSSPTAEA